MSLFLQHQVAAHVVRRTSCRLETIRSTNLDVANTLIERTIRVCHPARVETRSQLLSDSLLVQLELSDLFKDLVEVLEEDLRLLTVQDVMVAHNGT